MTIASEPLPGARETCSSTRSPQALEQRDVLLVGHDEAGPAVLADTTASDVDVHVGAVLRRLSVSNRTLPLLSVSFNIVSASSRRAGG